MVLNYSSFTIFCFVATYATGSKTLPKQKTNKMMTLENVFIKSIVSNQWVETVMPSNYLCSRVGESNNIRSLDECMGTSKVVWHDQHVAYLKMDKAC